MNEPDHKRAATVESEAWTTRRLLRWIQGHLEERSVDAPRVCSEFLVGKALGSDRLRLYMEPDRVAAPDELQVLRELVARAARHEPVQYLVGSWPFFGREFEVGPCTLIPRPATERLVEEAIAEVTARGVHRPWRILDLCTGTGCIGVSLAAAIASLRAGRVSDRLASAVSVPPQAPPAGDDLPVLDLEQRELRPDRSSAAETGALEASTPSAAVTEAGPLAVTVSDIVADAVALAVRNAERSGIAAHVEPRVGSLFEVLEPGEAASFDLICANPPYVTDAEYLELDRNVRDYEPAGALRGGSEGLDLIRPILEQAPTWLAPGGLLLVEIGGAMHDSVLELARSVAGLRDARILRDHEDHHRVLVARCGPAS